MFVAHSPATHPLIHAAPPHPTAVSETHCMSSGAEHTPALWYTPTVTQGLSQVQLEALVLICQSHERWLPPDDRERSGFCLGDGTGVGKGRVLAAVFAERWALRSSRTVLRGVWVSVTPDLAHAARQDLREVGGEHIPFMWGKSKRHLPPQGLVFCTYPELARGGPNARAILGWVAGGDECVMLFDESHRAKCSTQSGGSRTSAMLLQLQRSVPHARVVYSSATGADSVRSMLHMERLGLWGRRRVFHTAGDFDRVMRKAGLGAMEMMSCELRQRGLYVSRQLDVSNLSMRVWECPLDRDQTRTYDLSAELWRDLAAAGGRSGSLLRTQQQRYFRTLLTAHKAPAAIALAERCLAAGQSVVFVLQATGESSLKRGCADAGLGEALRRALQSAEPPFPPALRASLGSRIADLAARLPLNPLDQLLRHFGAERVAEISGRSYRLRSATPPVSYEKRTLSNEAERGLFMAGRKRVAILTSSGSSGISLHSSLEHANQQQRAQIVLEVPWSPTTFVQQMGRVHRCNQKSLPDIFLLSTTNVPAEQRFTATLHHRLQVLGALTGGDRRAISHTRQMGHHFSYGDQVTRRSIHALLRDITVRTLAARHRGGALLPAHAALRQLGVAPDRASQECLADAACERLHQVYTSSMIQPWNEQWVSCCEFRTPSVDDRSARFGQVMAVRQPPAMASATAPWLYYDPYQSQSGGAEMSFVPYVTQLQANTRIIDAQSARVLWDPDRYAEHLALLFVSAGGHLPAVVWSAPRHREFPDPFKSAIGALRDRMSEDALHSVCEFASNWYRHPKDPYRDMVNMQVLHVPVHKVSNDMWFNALLTTPLHQQRIYFEHLADLCRVARLRGEADVGIEGVVVSAVEVRDRHEWRLSRDERVELLDLSVLPLDHTLGWGEMARMCGCAEHDLWQQNRSKRFCVLLKKPDRWQLWSVADRRKPSRTGTPQQIRRLLDDRYTRVATDRAAHSRWEAQRRALVPSRRRVLLLTGSLLRWWSALHGILDRARVGRARTTSLADEVCRYTGLCIPPKVVGQVRSLLGSRRP